MLCCRYLLKHNQYDGLDAVLEAYSKHHIYLLAQILVNFADLDDDGIAAVREAKIVTSIDVSEEGEVSVATSDAESSEDPNVVTFTPGADNITISNPLNGEMVAVGSKYYASPIAQLFSNVFNILSLKGVYWVPASSGQNPGVWIPISWKSRPGCLDQLEHLS